MIWCIPNQDPTVLERRVAELAREIESLRSGKNNRMRGKLESDALTELRGVYMASEESPLKRSPLKRSPAQRAKKGKQR